MPEQANETLWDSMRELIGRLERAPHWPDRRDACEELGRIAEQAIYRLRRAAEDSDPDVAHWGRQFRDHLTGLVSSPLAELALRMDKELAEPAATEHAAQELSTQPQPSVCAPNVGTLLEWLEEFAKRTGGAFARRGEVGASVALPLEPSRRQTVFLDYGQADRDSVPHVLFYSVCGVATPEVFAWALETNATLTRGAFGVIQHEDKSVLILLLRRRLDELPLVTLEKKLLYLAHQADLAEGRLSAEDRH